MGGLIWGAWNGGPGVVKNVPNPAIRIRKNKQFCVQEFSADIEFYEMTRRGGKLARCIVDCHI